MSATDHAVLAALAKACGEAARAATAADAVDGVQPAYVVSPASTQATAEVMRTAAEHNLAVLARGAGTKLGWGAPPSRVDVILDTTALDGVIDHAAGDLVVQARAGTRLDVLQEALAPAGQRLAIDPIVHGGTIGGTIATGPSGPLRLSHGGVRDLLIGVTFVRADGVVAKAGGTVVKNVAGYDLAKMLTGSWGTLGVITEAVFRLHPLPAARRWVSVEVSDAGTAHDLVQRLVHSQLAPAAVEFDRPAAGPATLSVLLEGIAPGVEGRTASLLNLLSSAVAATSEAPDWWGRPPWGERDVALRLTHEIAGLPALLGAVAELSASQHVPIALRGSAAVGVHHAGLPGSTDPEVVAALVTGLRRRATTWGGDVVVLDAPAATKQVVDIWGPVAGLDLMRRVKNRFDPHHRLGPGRFAGGI